MKRKLHSFLPIQVYKTSIPIYRSLVVGWGEYLWTSGLRTLARGCQSWLGNAKSTL